jgi:hypothetical protein
MLTGIVLGRYFGEKNKDGRKPRARLVFNFAATDLVNGAWSVGSDTLGLRLRNDWRRRDHFLG